MKIWYRETILSPAFKSLMSGWGRRTGLQREAAPVRSGPWNSRREVCLWLQGRSSQSWGLKSGSQTQLKGGLDALEIRPAKGCELAEFTNELTVAPQQPHLSLPSIQ